MSREVLKWILMLAYRKKWEVIVLAEGSHEGGSTAFEVPNIGDSVVYRTEAVRWDLV